jgi:inorganic pyrophosphatase
LPSDFILHLQFSSRSLMSLLLAAVLTFLAPVAAPQARPLGVLPAAAAAQLTRSLAAAAPHRRHVWRDSPPANADGTVNGYIEIARGDRRKFEFDMKKNARAIDRVMPEKIGGYPVNYGFVPQTISYDGDPFDILVLGPALRGGSLVRGVVVGLMQMEDEKGLDSKVVVSPLGRDGRPLYELTPAIRDEIAGYFRRYKEGEPGKFSKVPGWGSVADGRDFVAVTHAFFKNCRQTSNTDCTLDPRAPGSASRDDLRLATLADVRGVRQREPSSAPAQTPTPAGTPTRRR